MRLTLESDRLILRPFVLEDAMDMYLGWTSDDEVTKFISWNSHESVETTKEILKMWIEQYDKPERINFAIELKSEKRLIGGIDVVGYLDGVPVIGYVLSRNYWNNGYMSEACKRVVAYLQSIGHNTIIIDALVDNIASNKTVLANGGVLINKIEKNEPTLESLFMEVTK